MQIREFQVDAKLDQFINLFFELFQSAKTMFKEIKLSDIVGMGSSGARDRWMTMIKDVIDACWNFCIGSEKPNMMQEEGGTSRWSDKLKSKPDTVIKALKSQSSSDLDLDTYLLEFPFLMYYRLQSCTTLNVYELPYVNDQIYSSDGSGGWKDADFGLADLSKNAGGDNGGMMSKIFEMVTGIGDFVKRVRINYMPKWDPSGGGTAEGLAVKFDLFNDTYDAAMKNFIFVNTIIPNNMWMQYGMLKHSPCLYDIKIEGLKRMFLCAGDFKVSSAGLLRTPPLEWISDLCYKHANGTGSKQHGSWDAGELCSSIIDHNLIKIPDVYTIEMTFKSLIPENFNNFLYSYSKNSQMETYINEPAHESSVVGNILKSIKTDLSDKVKAIMDEANSDISKIHAQEETEKNKNGKNGKK